MSRFKDISDNSDDFFGGQGTTAPKSRFSDITDDKEDFFNSADKPKKSGFTPSIGGVIPKSEETYSNPNYWLAKGLGGAVTRGIPGIRDLIPITETDQQKTLEHPIVEKAGNITGAALPGMATAGVGGGLSLPAWMAAQGGINAAVNTADRKIHDPNVSGKDLNNKAVIDLLAGAAGPAASKAISPIMYSSGSPQALLDNIKKSDAISAARRGADTVAGYAQYVLPKLATDAKAALFKGWIGNQLMQPGAKAGLSGVIQGTERTALDSLTPQERMKLEMLQMGN